MSRLARPRHNVLVVVISTMLGVTSLILAPGALGHLASAAAALQADSLQPGPGQYVPIAPTMVLDTRYGTGEPSGTSGAIAPGAAVTNVPILGVGPIPPSGVSSVFVVVQELSERPVAT